MLEGRVENVRYRRPGLNNIKQIMMDIGTATFENVKRMTEVRAKIELNGKLM